MNKADAGPGGGSEKDHTYKSGKYGNIKTSAPTKTDAGAVGQPADMAEAAGIGSCAPPPANVGAVCDFYHPELSALLGLE